MPPKNAETDDPLIRRLRTLAKDLPDLKDVAQVYEAILPLIRDADLHIAPISLTQEQTHRKTGKDLPLLADLALDLDGEAVRGLMAELAAGRVDRDHSKLMNAFGSILRAR